ncbi:MAG: DUF4252 domain-containing protein [Flavobacteriaceae bacterium]|nr:DUF4252 domain-containing protein [Flavobacteriaceae bacterium]
MKKLLLNFLITITCGTLFAQDIFERFYDYEDVTLVSLNDQLFKIIANMQLDLDTPADEEIYDIISSIRSFNLIESRNDKVNTELKKWLNNCINDGYTELMNIRDNNSDVRFYVKQGEYQNTFEQFVMYVSNMDDFPGVPKEIQALETVVFSLEGDIDINQISEIANRLDFPGSEIIKESVEKKNK